MRIGPRVDLDRRCRARSHHGIGRYDAYICVYCMYSSSSVSVCCVCCLLSPSFYSGCQSTHFGIYLRTSRGSRRGGEEDQWTAGEFVLFQQEEEV